VTRQSAETLSAST